MKLTKAEMDTQPQLQEPELLVGICEHEHYSEHCEYSQERRPMYPGYTHVGMDLVQPRQDLSTIKY